MPAKRSSLEKSEPTLETVQEGPAVRDRGYEVPGDERAARGDSPGGRHPEPATDEPVPGPHVADVTAVQRAVALADSGGARPGRLRLALDLIRANPTGRVVLKIVVAILGALVVSVGIALIPLPGPGWLLVIAGLGIWAVEFHWAKRLLGFTRRHVHNWTKWATSRSLPVRMVLGTVGLVFVAVVLWASLKFSLGIDLIALARHRVGTH